MNYYNKNYIIYLFLTLISFVIFVPLYWTFITSLKPPTEIFTKEILYWPKTPTLENYVYLVTSYPFGRQLMNSAFVSGLSSFFAVIIASFAAYSFSRFAFKGRRQLLSIVLIFSMLPAVLFMIPYFDIMSRLKLLNTYWSLIITYTAGALPFSVWMQLGYFSSIPKELDESAMIDGCSRRQVLFKIVFPLAAPGIFAAYVFAFVGSWDEFILASVLTSSEDMRTASVGIWAFIGEHTTEWGPMCAAVISFIIPVLILFSIIQKYIVRGLTAGALKA
jgi:multiple sugar transport system permease protein